MALKRHRLCHRRKALGLSQEGLAEILGVERSTIVRWEGAETDPQPWHRSRIADALRVTLEQLDEMLVDVSVATRRGRIMGEDTRDPVGGAVPSDLLAGLRTFLTSYLPDRPVGPIRPLVDVRRSVGRVHSLYQRASYSSAARLLPDVLAQATDLATHAPQAQRVRAFQLLAAAYLAASKLAAKVGDGESALMTADRASTAAGLAGDRALLAVAAYQAACGLLRLPGRADQTAEVLEGSIGQLSSEGPLTDPELISAQGALLLLAAVVAAGGGEQKTAGRLLSQADGLATALGSDRNCLWTAFGPTNVAIHTVSAAVRAGNPDQATAVALRLDTSRLPTVLVGRRAQVHVDLAAASMMGSADRSAAVLHLLEAERTAAEVVKANLQARELIRDLLSKERRAATPGLRPLAERAGLLV
ncbi:helix-turn-helix transcriptional regulator [Micromonospora sp. LH3U1]|uniref:helix-turn-helix transcriptional regulator n=1 Tax=Micromonospora sp. LH3U1 TaxID=3018339 RepID=UPI00234BED7D|nr:helix-turn-helix transcriptional regulator [Micromonospora sp. LH3U1]WCN82521.1 helix-turn-helix transcriptional regulator [Micromonospora sp. LH3U1]